VHVVTCIWTSLSSLYELVDVCILLSPSHFVCNCIPSVTNASIGDDRMACFRNINTSHGDTERVGLQKLPGPIIVAGKNLHPLLVPTLRQPHNVNSQWKRICAAPVELTAWKRSGRGGCSPRYARRNVWRRQQTYDSLPYLRHLVCHSQPV
jgi:hypothetical protein